MKYEDIDFNKIKLVIWDLDDTFWKGTLSEGPISRIESNINVVKGLTDRGIINSICSKNDEESTIKELEAQGVSEFFVFKSIDWSPKGQRIQQLIAQMQLRAANCLFIDDNIVNLNEAKFYSSDLMIAQPDIISSLEQYIKSTEAKDSSHKRLNQYIILEKKQIAKEQSSDNLEFLMNANTQVSIRYDCINQIDRIVELVARTNQLNYTKRRSNKEELLLLFDDKDVKCGYVTVSDIYGDYGIVGFFAIKNNKCIHFLFSCRTIGQGVEQWVYSNLGFPELEVVGEVINDVKKVPAPVWINQEHNVSTGRNTKEKLDTKIVFKGACDLSIMASYLNSTNIIEEFTYIGPRGNRIEHQNHSTNYLEFSFLSDDQRRFLLDECVFNDQGMFETKMYDDDVSLVFLSTQIEPMLGIYERKEGGIKVAALEYCYPLTDNKYWDAYVNGTLPSSQNTFTYEWLQSFSEKYVFKGRITPVAFISQLERLFTKLPNKTRVCLLLGSEIPYLKNTQEGFIDRHFYYQELNTLVKEYAQTNDRLYYINFTDYIKDQSDFTDNINHYKRHIYYEAALKANEIIENVTGSRVREYSKLRFFCETSYSYVRRFLRKTIKQLLKPFLSDKQR